MKNAIEKTSVFLVGLVAAGYLLNIGWGWIELIPDNLPILGNLDEATATTLLLGALAYFGFDVSRIFKGSAKRATGRNAASPPVIDVEAEARTVDTGASPGR